MPAAITANTLLATGTRTSKIMLLGRMAGLHISALSLLLKKQTAYLWTYMMSIMIRIKTYHVSF